MAGAIIRAYAADGVGTLLAVCYDGVIRALLDHFLDLAPRRIIPVGPASVTAVRIGKDGRARLEFFTCLPDTPGLAPPD